MNAAQCRVLLAAASITVSGALATAAFAQAEGAQAGAPSAAEAAAAAPQSEPSTATPPGESAAPPDAPQSSAVPTPATTQVGKNALPAVPPGKGQVVFFRPSRLGGMALSFSVHEGQTGVGKLGNGSYFVLAADPGTHKYTIESEATDTLTLEVDAGETYYVQQTIGMGVMVGRPHLTPSDAGAFGAKALKLSTKKPSDLTSAKNDKTAPEAATK
jgi:hypothetical protein